MGCGCKDQSIQAASVLPEMDMGPEYWNARYEQGSAPGAGSRGRLKKYKLDTVQKIVEEYKIGSIVDVGCGDGAQLRDLVVGQYRGIDPSEAAIDQAIAASPRKAPDWIYHVMDEEALAKGRIADMSVSLDVLFHLPDSMYEPHLEILFGLAKKYVLIYSPNRSGKGLRLASHMFFREFVPDVKRMFGAEPILHIPPPFVPVPGSSGNNTSYSDFYLFEVEKPKRRKKDEG